MSLLKQKNLLIAGGAVLAAICVGAVALGHGYLLVPMIMVGGLYVVIAKIFDIFSGLHVVDAHMWADVRKKPSKVQQLQILAFLVSVGLVAAFYTLWL